MKELDARNTISAACTGIYRVYKKNQIAQFGFGGSNSFENSVDAFNAMNKYLAKRKDRNTLTVYLVNL